MLTRQDWLLLALSKSPCGAMSPVQIQKAMFLFGREAGDAVGTDFYSFQPYDYGPFDAAIYADLAAQENEPSLAGRLGDARAAQGALEDAIAAYQTVVAVWPDSHRVRFQLARTWEQQSALDSAAVHYGIIVGLAEWEGLVGWRLAQVLGRMGKDNLGRIEKLLRDVLADYPDSAPALLCMAGLLHRTGSNEEALMHLQKVVSMHPDVQSGLSIGGVQSGLSIGGEYRAYGLMESVYRAMGQPKEAAQAAELYREKRLRQRADRRVLGNLEALLQGGTP